MPSQEAPKTYEDFADEMTDRMQCAFTIVRSQLGVAASRTKRYYSTFLFIYDLRVKKKEFKPGGWVYAFNPRKYVGKQDKWRKKFNGPFLVLKNIGPVNLLLQKSPRTQPFVIHIDKVKEYYSEEKPNLG